MLYYVERDGSGAIIALYANPQEGRTDPQPLPDTDPEVAAFLNPPPPMPVLTSRQLRLGLVANGISLPSVEAAIDAIEDEADREVARIEWEYATTFERSHPLIEQVGSALGLTPEQIDDMWTEAATL
jgi:hypothetical protein